MKKSVQILSDKFVDFLKSMKTNFFRKDILELLSEIRFINEGIILKIKDGLSLNCQVSLDSDAE